MSERPLSVHIYRDSISPNMSIDAGWQGVELVGDIAPWVQVTEHDQSINLASSVVGCVATDSFPERGYRGDMNLILTERTIISPDTVRVRWSLLRKQATPDSYIGWSGFHNRVNSTRVALVNTVEITRPDHTVAHEIGHLLGLWMQKEDLHCDSVEDNCVGLAALTEEPEPNDTDFCHDCTEELFTHATLLRHAKSGRLGLAPNSKIF
jgi:hypothetical protein